MSDVLQRGPLALCGDRSVGHKHEPTALSPPLLPIARGSANTVARRILRSCRPVSRRCNGSTAVWRQERLSGRKGRSVSFLDSLSVLSLFAIIASDPPPTATTATRNDPQTMPLLGPSLHRGDLQEEPEPRTKAWGKRCRFRLSSRSREGLGARRTTRETSLWGRPLQMHSISLQTLSQGVAVGETS